MRIKSLILFLFLTNSVAALAATEMTVGDGLIDGNRVKPYQHSWQQCSLQDGQWLDQGSVAEELVIIGDHVLRHRQIARQPSGVVSRSDTYFDRASFAPLRMEMEATKEGTRLAYVERQLDAEGYTGVSIKGESSNPLQGSISSEMLHGAVMGLPLATMAFQEEPVEFLASMIGFDGTYDVIAEWAGKESLQFEGQEIETWLIDVEWHHRESGDIYPPGPDASGGRYWVVAKPPAGFPHVPRYKTDTYAVEFVADVCPTTTE